MRTINISDSLSLEHKLLISVAAFNESLSEKGGTQANFDPNRVKIEANDSIDKLVVLKNKPAD
uniref:Uncharacterized protein n=1 Tax=Romanomermis culicivorax TaxID=13658 RepID=A0A915JFY8_ROMCU